MDGDTVVAEVWDYKLRKSIENGEIDLKTSKITKALHDHALHVSEQENSV
jgi:hypothetical protein